MANNTKDFRAYLKTDLETTSAEYVHEGLIGYEDIKRFPAMSIMVLGVKMKKLGEGLYTNVLNVGLGIYVKGSGDKDITDKLDDLYDELLDNEFDAVMNKAEAIEITGYTYDAYNDKTKGTAYVSVEIQFNY